ncbi:CopG family ribbon-helix-helix protein [Zavarzinia sp. CC-PAN008]|uniref:CopG family ribbon-helix-helix protein n=1 Tax=Zavarzinia sp. CC-PAN008 TaxID=3243332 RepID=UPI003F745FD3
MGETTFTFRVDADLMAAFEETARAQGRSIEDLIQEFMREVVEQPPSDPEYDAWFREQVQIGLDEADAGLLISHEEVEAEAAAWRAEVRASWSARPSRQGEAALDTGSQS